MTEPQVVILAGMHRSGTSLLSSVLQRAGVDIGETLVEPSVGNQRGHFEDSAFVALHEQIFAVRNLDLLTATSVVQPTEAEIAQAHQLIQNRADRPIWGWKDPRTSLLLDFWHGLIPQANFVLVYRHPLSVILSLLRRGTDIAVLVEPWLGLQAWVQYNQALIDFYQRHPAPCYLTSIDQATANLSDFCRQIADRFQLPLNPTGADQLYHAAEFQRPSFAPETDALLAEISPTAMDVYRQLNELSGSTLNVEKSFSDVTSFQSPSALEDIHSVDLTSAKLSLLLTALAPTVMNNRPARLQQTLQARRSRLAEAEAAEAELHQLKQTKGVQLLRWLWRMKKRLWANR